MDNIEDGHHLVFNSIARDDLIGLETTLNIYPAALESLDKCLNTPLLYACSCGRNRIVHYLLRFGANHERLNIFGKYRYNHATSREKKNRLRVTFCTNFNSRSKCSDTGNVFGWSQNMLRNTQPHQFRWNQYNRHFDTIMCGCTAREYRHSQILFDTGNTKAKSLRLSKWIDSRGLPTAISSNQRRHKYDGFITTKSSFASIQTAYKLTTNTKYFNLIPISTLSAHKMCPSVNDLHFWFYLFTKRFVENFPFNCTTCKKLIDWIISCYFYILNQ